MQFFIYCFTALVGLGAAELNPHSAIPSSLSTVPEFGKRLTTPELTLYLTPDIVRALQDVKSSKNAVPSIGTSEQNTQSNQENYNQGVQKIYSEQSEPTSIEKSQTKNRGFVSRFFFPREKDVIENKEKNDLTKIENLEVQRNMYRQLQNSQQNNANKEEGQIQINANSLPYIPVSYKNQEELILHEQLQQHWNRILDHNRAQLQGLSASREEIDIKSLRQTANNDIQQKKPRIETQPEIRIESEQTLKSEDSKSDVGKEIENILKNHQAFSYAKSNSPDQDKNQGPPILIHKEVTITKHHPVPIYTRVEVPIPRPVLVPVPEPYEVKVLHPYPVPVDVVKHIPVPVVRNSKFHEMTN